MSNSASRVIFNDGTMLYSVGDNLEFARRRLYDTREEAWDHYASERVEFIPEAEYEAASGDDEGVRVETTYGDGYWTEMQAFYGCRASRSKKIITVPPRIPMY